MGTTPLSLLAERARKDSLFKRLERAGALADFFSWFYAESPSEPDCLAWLEKRGCKSSTGAVSNMVLRHGLAYRIGQAEEASDAVGGSMPTDAEERGKQAIKARFFETTLSLLGQKEIIALEKMNRQSEFEREKLAFEREKFAESSRQKREELALSREKFETDAAALALKFVAELKSIAANRTLTEPARIDAARKRLFGVAPVPATPEAPR